MGAVLAVLIGVVAVSALAQPAEQKPVNALLSALQRGDDVALADLLLPSLRANDVVADANAVLSNALGRSQIGFISIDWLRKWGPVTGTKIAFENLILSLCDRRTDLLSREHDTEKLSGIYEFPRELRKLRAPLVQFLVELCKPTQLGSAPFLLLINKSDLTEEWSLEEDEIEEIKGQGWQVIRTSAKTGLGVEEAFLTLSQKMLGT